MALNLGEDMENLFPHSVALSQGLGNQRIGQTEVSVGWDGTCDFESIQEAINSLPTSGGTVRVKEGNYTISSSITMKSNVKLTGSGKSTKIIATFNDSIIKVGVTGGHQDMIIENLWIYGSSAGASQDGIYLPNIVQNVFIRNIWVSNCGNHGIYLNDTNKVLLDGCTCTTNDGDGILMKVTQNSRAVNNRCKQNVGHGIELMTDGPFSCDYNIIMGNVCTSNTAGQVTLTDGGGVATGNIIDHNIVDEA